jgi:hypothetical protein
LTPDNWRLLPPGGNPISLLPLAALALLVGLCTWMLAVRKRRTLIAIRFRVAMLAAGLIMAMVMTWGACGGGSVAPTFTNPNATPAGTYNLTVTGTYVVPGSSAQIVHNSTIVMTVH